MKKLTKLFSLALVALMSAVMVSCDDPEPQPEPKPEPTPEVTTPTISVTAGEAGEDWISFSVTSANIKRAFYVAVSEDVINDVTIDVDFVLESPNMVPKPNTTCEILFEGRTPDTTYYIYAAAINENGDKVLSECVEMKTLAHEYTTVVLPEADYCDINLTVLSSTDRYTFELSDEENTLYFTFNLYTAAGCNGAIPTGTYTISNVAAANSIELNSIYMEYNGLPTAISEGSMEVELYDEGKKIKLNGNFKLVTNDTALFEYDGDVTITGLGGSYDDTIVFTRVPMVGTNGEPGHHEIQFQPAEGTSMLNLQFYSDPAKKYLTDGRYQLFGSADAANAAGFGKNWIYVVEGAPAGSFYQDDMMIPSIILTGSDSYVDVATDMDEGVDYYEITFSLKLQSLMDQSVSTLKAVYKGSLGFTPSEEAPTMRMESMYVDVTTEGNAHTFNFHGGFTTMIVTVEGELPEIGDDYLWFDVVSGKFSDAYAGIYDHPITDGRFAIKRYPDAADASDEGKVKAYYGFEIEGKLVDVYQKDSETGEETITTYDLVGDWKSFHKEYVSEW